MAKRRKGGHRAPAQYDPRRGKKSQQRSNQPRAGEVPSDGRETRRGGTSERADVVRFDAEGKLARATQKLGQAQQPAAPTRTTKLEASLTHPAEIQGLAFSDLGLGPNLVRSLGELGATAPFTVQAATIPDMIAGHDVLGRARTGSGKTIAFGAGIVERLLLLKAAGAFSNDPKPSRQSKRGVRDSRPKTVARNPKVMILAPTRELALQIDATVQPLARSVGFYTAQLVGGIPIDPQVHALERGVDIVIGTPGRMQDLVDRRRLDLRDVVISVIDEADHMCDLGFLEPTQRLLRYTVRGGQRILFSATLDDAVSHLIDEFLDSAKAHEIVDEHEAKDTDHRVFIVPRGQKDRVLIELVTEQRRRSKQTMVFCRTRAYAAQVAELLTEHEVSAVPLHGELSQIRRERNLERFASGKAEVLVATDVAARGIHIDHVDLVVQADPPGDAKTYLHRAGRTGRAGQTGRAITLIGGNREQRTREMLSDAGVTAAYFGQVDPKTVVQHS